jgi:hypothetical protein
MATLDKAKEIGKEAVKVYFSDTPKWAKIVRLAGIVLSAVGGTLALTNPVTAPVGIAVLIPYSGYMTAIGTFSALFVQGFSKKE